MNLQRHFRAALLMVLATEALPQEPECMNDAQCKGEQICVRATCRIPQLFELFPGASTPTPGLYRYVIKTTRADCINRGGQLERRKTDEPKDERPAEVARCVLPVGVKPEGADPERKPR
jgi:hypothetical protein